MKTSLWNLSNRKGSTNCVMLGSESKTDSRELFSSIMKKPVLDNPIMKIHFRDVNICISKSQVEHSLTFRFFSTQSHGKSYLLNQLQGANWGKLDKLSLRVCQTQRRIFIDGRRAEQPHSNRVLHFLHRQI